MNFIHDIYSYKSHWLKGNLQLATWIKISKLNKTKKHINRLFTIVNTLKELGFPILCFFYKI